MNMIRLNKLADVLENFKTEVKNLFPLPGNGRVGAFDLDSWGEEGASECSTTACAAGTAGLHPWFRAKGLTMVGSWGNYSIRFKDEYDFDACARFFNISDVDADFLFNPERYALGRRGAKSVARRIRYVVAGGQHRGDFAGLKA